MLIFLIAGHWSETLTGKVVQKFKKAEKMKDDIEYRKNPGLSDDFYGSIINHLNNNIELT